MLAHPVTAKWRFATSRPTDSYIVYNDVFNDPSYLRYSKEITVDNGDRLNNFHSLNMRVDYRKQLGRIALVGFLDVVDVYDHLNVT